MSFWSYLAIALAGTGAGLINTVVGSGSLITFPTLLFFGVNPLVANVSNNIGLVAGGVDRRLGLPPRADGAGGHPAAAHAAVVRRVRHRRRPAARAAGRVPSRRSCPCSSSSRSSSSSLGPRIQAVGIPDEGDAVPRWHAPAMGAGVLVAGMYGGYFGAAQGVLLMGILSALSAEPLQRLNGYKNVLALVVNVVAAAVFVLFARDQIDWLIVVLIAAGAPSSAGSSAPVSAGASRRTACGPSSSSSVSSPSSS